MFHYSLTEWFEKRKKNSSKDAQNVYENLFTDKSAKENDMQNSILPSNEQSHIVRGGGIQNPTSQPYEQSHMAHKSEIQNSISLPYEQWHNVHDFMRNDDFSVHATQKELQLHSYENFPTKSTALDNQAQQPNYENLQSAKVTAYNLNKVLQHVTAGYQNQPAQQEPYEALQPNEKPEQSNENHLSYEKLSTIKTEEMHIYTPIKGISVCSYYFDMLIFGK